MKEMNEPEQSIQEKAIEALAAAPEGLSYRDLVTQVTAALPDLSRDLVTATLGELPRTRGEAVWRPKPGTFKLRTEGEGPAQYARGRKRREVEAEPRAWPEKPLPNRVENLQRLGFAPVGEWRRTMDGIDCVYTGTVDKASLLAYVVSDSVVYIGRAHRDTSVPAPRSGFITRSIRNVLARDRTVRVFALSEWVPCEHKGMMVNVGAGIADELVQRMQPPWNH